MERILFVDDEENILAGYKRNLRNMFNIFTANSGAEALELIKNNGNFAVVVSDYKMPQMNGNQLLSAIRQQSPDTVRMMLTGFADVETAINAVNEGNIFRLLTKPCPNDKLINSLYAALEQYRLIIAERELLDKTLKGSIKVLMDILAVVNPTAFSQSNQFRNLAKKIAEKIQIKNLWKIELSALLSQIGCVAVPSEIIEKRNEGKELTNEELGIYYSHPKMGMNLIRNIPRLEEIADAIKFQFYRYDGSDEPEDYIVGEKIPESSRILRALNDYFFYTGCGMTSEEAVKKLFDNSNYYDPDVLAALNIEITGMYDGFILETVNLNELKPGMILAEDIKNDEGSVLLTKRNEITDVLIYKLNQYNRIRKIIEPIKVLILKK